MDVHRCRFVKWSPHAINALAFSHSSGASGRDRPLRLAVARANGDIELWDPRGGAWLHETTLRGGSRNSVEALAWTHDADTDDGTGYIVRGKLRLFSVGHSEAITEWNLITGQPLQISNAGHSEIWCVAAQPEHAKSSKQEPSDATKLHEQKLAAGCADGSIVLYSTDPELSFNRFVTRASQRHKHALSIAWQHPNIILAGFSDSSIKIFNTDTGTHLRTLSLGGNPRKGLKDKLVWALHCLDDASIVSADSSGDITFWHGNTYAQLQKLKGHENDALCLTSNKNGNLLFSGGMDRRVVIYSRKRGKGTALPWSKISHKRYHAHDVKTMTCFESPSISIMVSGGLDSTPVVVPARQFGHENHRRLSHIPQKPQVVGAQRWLVTWTENIATIWMIKPFENEEDLFLKSRPQAKYKTVGRVVLKTDVCNVVISKCGSFLLVMTATKSKAFYLERNGVEPISNWLKIKCIPLPKHLKDRTIRIADISPDSRWLLTVDAKNTIYVTHVDCANIKSSGSCLSEEPLKVERGNESSLEYQNWLNGPWGSYSRTVCRVTFSSNSRLIAISDLSGALEVWMLTRKSTNLASKDNTKSSSKPTPNGVGNQQQSDTSSAEITPARPSATWQVCALPNKLPQLSAPVAVMCFRPHGTATTQVINESTDGIDEDEEQNSEQGHDIIEDTLVVLTSLHELYEFDARGGTLTSWSKRNAPENLPDEFKIQRDRAMGCFWQKSVNQHTKIACSVVWFYSTSWLCMFDLSQDLTQEHQTSLKRTHSGALDDSSLSIGKRKRGPHVKTRTSKVEGNFNAEPEIQQTSGAGSWIRENELTDAVSSTISRPVDAERKPTVTSTNFTDGDRTASSRTTEDSIARDGFQQPLNMPSVSNASTLLSQTRENSHIGATEINMGPEVVHNGISAVSAPVNDIASANYNVIKAQPQRFYLTTRYRNILGIVPLEQTSSTPPMAGQSSLEVAIVERPLWEADLLATSSRADLSEV